MSEIYHNDFSTSKQIFFKMREDVNSHRIQMHQKSLLLFKAYNQNICYKVLLGLGLLLWTIFHFSWSEPLLQGCWLQTGEKSTKSLVDTFF